MIKTPRHPASERRPQASILILLIGLLALAACETTGVSSTGGSGENRAQRMASNGDHDEAAGAYMGLAVNARGIGRDR